MWDAAFAGLEANLLNFASFFGVAMVLLALFVVLYIHMTPYNEFELIRAGNMAASISLGGRWSVLPCRWLCLSRSIMICWRWWFGAV